jgi:hypothetical protein
MGQWRYTRICEARFIVGATVAWLLVSCRPVEHSESTAPDHEQAAAREDADAAAHQAEAATDAQAEKHLREAQRHREAAALHRSHADALRATEARVCVGIPAAERAASPLEQPDGIRSVEPAHVTTPSGKFTTTRLVGARVVVLAQPGLTAEWLQRLLDCHLAHMAAVGPAAAHADACPLALPGVSATVTSVGDGFAVVIVADDEESAAIVLARARAIIEPIGNGSTGGGKR